VKNLRQFWQRNWQKKGIAEITEIVKLQVTNITQHKKITQITGNNFSDFSNNFT